MASYRLISSDSHVIEPADLWTSRIEPRFRDRAPHVVREDDGDWWYCDGIKTQGTGAGAQAGMRFEEPEKLSYRDWQENVRLGGYIPEEHVKDMDIDGVDVGIVYPNQCLPVYIVPDGELLSAIFRTYNDWVAEFCQAFPDRLKGIGMLNMDDIQSGVKELERCAKMGLVGVNITVYPPDDRAYDSPEYEPLWATAEDLGVPVSLHVGTNRPGGASQEIQSLVDMRPAFSSTFDHWVKVSLAHIIFSGVFERHPNLQLGAVEHELSWVPLFVERMDYAYTQRPQGDSWLRFKNDMLPGDFFHRNVFLGFQEDSLGIELRHRIGVDQILWGSDYPHFESTFPRSRQILEEILADCTEEEKAKIAGGNSARVYNID